MCGPYGNDDFFWQRQRDREISKVFNKFAGKEVNPADPNDPVLKEMRHEAMMRYSYIRLVAEGAQPERDPAKITQISAELVPTDDGKWKIGNRFFRG